MKTTRYSTNTIWEKKYAYSRALRKGNFIFVSGTTSVNAEGEIVGKGDIGKQAAFIFENIKKAIEHLGGSLEDVVRTRLYVVEGNDWEAAANVHGKLFEDIRPAETLLMISSLVNSDLLIEIEAEALVVG